MIPTSCPVTEPCEQGRESRTQGESSVIWVMAQRQAIFTRKQLSDCQGVNAESPMWGRWAPSASTGPSLLTQWDFLRPCSQPGGFKPREPLKEMASTMSIFIAQDQRKSNVCLWSSLRHGIIVRATSGNAQAADRRADKETATD